MARTRKKRSSRKRRGGKPVLPNMRVDKDHSKYRTATLAEARKDIDERRQEKMEKSEETERYEEMKDMRKDRAKNVAEESKNLLAKLNRAKKEKITTKTKAYKHCDETHLPEGAKYWINDAGGLVDTLEKSAPWGKKITTVTEDGIYYNNGMKATWDKTDGTCEYPTLCQKEFYKKQNPTKCGVKKDSEDKVVSTSKPSVKCKYRAGLTEEEKKECDGKSGQVKTPAKRKNKRPLYCRMDYMKNKPECKAGAGGGRRKRKTKKRRKKTKKRRRKTKKRRRKNKRKTKRRR